MVFIPNGPVPIQIAAAGVKVRRYITSVRYPSSDIVAGFDVDLHELYLVHVYVWSCIMGALMTQELVPLFPRVHARVDRGTKQRVINAPNCNYVSLNGKLI